MKQLRWGMVGGVVLSGLGALIGPGIAEACQVTLDNYSTGGVKILRTRIKTESGNAKVSGLSAKHLAPHKRLSKTVSHCRDTPARVEVKYLCSQSRKQHTAVLPAKGKPLANRKKFVVPLRGCDKDVPKRVGTGLRSPAPNHSADPVISKNGEWVAFTSPASTLVGGDTNKKWDVFLWSKKSNKLKRISVNRKGKQGNGDSTAPSISPNGRYIAYQSSATNLVPGDTNKETDVFVFDRKTKTTTRASVDSLNKQSKFSSTFPTVSNNGRVAFHSLGGDLVHGDTNKDYDVFVRDLIKKTTSRVSLTTGGKQANGGSRTGGISADGNRVFFRSQATNLIPGKTLTKDHLYLYDVKAKKIFLIDASTEGIQGDTHALSQEAELIDNGRKVIFGSKATNLVPGATLPRNMTSIYLRNLETGATSLLQASASSPQASSTGRYIFYMSHPSRVWVLRDVTDPNPNSYVGRWGADARDPALADDGKSFAYQGQTDGPKNPDTGFITRARDVYWRLTKP